MLFVYFTFRPVIAGRVGKVSKSPRQLPHISKKPAVLTDARMRIIKTKRTKIDDARDIIAVNKRKTLKDAREIISKREYLMKPMQATKKKPQIPHLKSAGARSLALRNEILLKESIDFGPPVSALRRTVKNDMFLSSLPPSMPKPPTFMFKNDRPARLSPELDPFDCYVVPKREHMPLPPMRGENSRFHPAGKLMSAHMDAYAKASSRYPRAAASSSRGDDHDDRMDTDAYSSVRSRLYQDSSRDSRNESAGIFAKMPVRHSSPPPDPTGHSIIISNLHKSVTCEDVVELFEDVGPLASARLIRPGVAEVVYKSLGDAEQAVDTYHNRQLDDQPMKCTLCPGKAPNYSKY